MLGVDSIILVILELGTNGGGGPTRHRFWASSMLGQARLVHLMLTIIRLLEGRGLLMLFILIVDGLLRAIICVVCTALFPGCAA